MFIQNSGHSISVAIIRIVSKISSISLWGSLSITPLASIHIPGESIVAVVVVGIVIPIQTSISIRGSFSITPLTSHNIPGKSIVAVVIVRVVIAVQETSISIRSSFSFSLTPLTSYEIPGKSIVAVVIVGVVMAVQKSSISISLRGSNSIRLCFSLSKGNKRQQNQKLHSDETLEVESH